MSVKTVWRAVTAEQNKEDRAANARVIVTETKPPEDGPEPIVFEIHAPEDALVASDVEGEWLFSWADVENYPYQVQHRQ